MKAVPSPAVHAWFVRQNSTQLFTTAICEAEILLGVTLLPEGQRKRDLETAAQRIFRLFAGRILAFDSISANAYAKITANAYAKITAKRRSAGQPIDGFDAQIAAIALT